MIKKIKIGTIYSEVKGRYVADFHYKFEKELNMATDHSTGEPTDCYGVVSIEYQNPVDDEKLNRWHQSRAPLYNPDHKYTEEELSHIIPISREEYELALKNDKN